MKNFSYPKVSPNAVSVNPDINVSLKVDEYVYRLYEESLKKNGSLATYNHLQSFVLNTFIKRGDALNLLEENEKWFKKGIEFINKHRPYLEKQDKDREKVTALLNSYPETNFSNFFENYHMVSASRLAHFIHYLDSNMDYFNQVTIFKLSNSAVKFRNSIIQFDYLNLLHERADDLLHLITVNFKNETIKRSDFVRTREQIEEAVKSKPGPQTPPKLEDDIKTILELIYKGSDLRTQDFLKKDGSLNINKTVKFAMDYPPFSKRWVIEECIYKSYSSRRLQSLFSDAYKDMKSSNSS